jgi:hypothetical protein
MIYIPTFEIHVILIRLKVMYQFFLPAIEIYIIHIGQKLIDKFYYAQMVGESLKQRFCRYIGAGWVSMGHIPGYGLT